MATQTATNMIAQGLLSEFDQEMEATRKVLANVPEKQLSWQPHDKSMSLGRLAAHVAEIPGWVEQTLNQDELDIAPPGSEGFTPAETDTVAKLLQTFDETVKKSRKIIASTSDQKFMKPWTFKKGGATMFTAPRVGVMRRFVMNHMIHHRAQLTVYLRLTGAKVPQTLGPTADYPDFAS